MSPYAWQQLIHRRRRWKAIALGSRGVARVPERQDGGYQWISCNVGGQHYHVLICIMYYSTDNLDAFCSIRDSGIAM